MPSDAKRPLSMVGGPRDGAVKPGCSAAPQNGGTPGDSCHLLDWLHVIDSSFPTGAYVHSAGLEALAPAGLEALEALLALRLRETVARFELVFLLHAYTAPLVPLDDQLHAMLLPREAREASGRVGTSLLRNACDLFDHPRLAAFSRDGQHQHLPVAFGAVAAALDVPERAAAATYAFQGVRSLVAAAQRLTRLGQRDAQRLVHRLKPVVEEAVATATCLRLEEAGAFAPAWDVAAMAHERAAARMFVS